MSLLALFVAALQSPPPIVRSNVQVPAVETLSVAPPVVITPIATPRKWTHASWLVEDRTSFTLAYTENQSGSAFGMYCDDQCGWFVNFNLECEQGEQYRAMLNATDGARPLTLNCVHIGKPRLLGCPVDEVSLDVIAKGGEIGIAVPRQSGAFSVSRFDLTGGAEAVAQSMSLSVENGKRSQNALKDYEL